MMSEENTTMVRVKDSLLAALRKKHPEWQMTPAVYLVDQLLRMFLEDKQ